MRLRPLTVMGLPSDGALPRGVSILVPPLPINAPDDPRPRDDVLHDLRSEEAALATKVGLRLFHSFTWWRGRRIQNQSHQWVYII